MSDNDNNSQNVQVSRSLGLGAAIFVFVGYIVGASIFILPGTIGAQTGPGLFVSYLLAAIPASFTAAVLAYVGSAYPVSGSTFVLIKNVLPPYFSAVTVMVVMMLLMVGLPLVAFGFADYVGYFLPGYNRQLIAAAVVVLFVLVNSRGIDITASIQELLVVVFCAVLLIFSIGGIASGSGERLTPMFPNGFSPVVAAAMTLYFSFTGANIVADIAGEIKHPGRNIPLTLLFGTLIILGLYLAVAIALMMTTDWSLGGGSTAIANAASNFLPPWLVTFVAIAALTAAATSINGPILGTSRNFLAYAREGLLPKFFARVSPKTHVPVRGVYLSGVLVLLGISFSSRIQDYADMTVIGFMALGVMLSWAAYRLPKTHPEVHAESPFKYSPLLHKVITLGAFVASLGILLLFAWKSWQMLAAFLGWVALGSLVWGMQKLKSRAQTPDSEIENPKSVV